MRIDFDAVFYEADALNYELGRALKTRFAKLPWIEIVSHNRIPEFNAAANKDFVKLKRHLIVGVRKTHKYTENCKVSDWLVPYTSSGCRAMCKIDKMFRRYENTVYRLNSFPLFIVFCMIIRKLKSVIRLF